MEIYCKGAVILSPSKSLSLSSRELIKFAQQYLSSHPNPELGSPQMAVTNWIESQLLPFYQAGEKTLDEAVAQKIIAVFIELAVGNSRNIDLSQEPTIAENITNFDILYFLFFVHQVPLEALNAAFYSGRTFAQELAALPEVRRYLASGHLTAQGLHDAGVALSVLLMRATNNQNYLADLPTPIAQLLDLMQTRLEQHVQDSLWLALSGSFELETLDQMVPVVQLWPASRVDLSLVLTFICRQAMFFACRYQFDTSREFLSFAQNLNRLAKSSEKLLQENPAYQVCEAISEFASRDEVAPNFPEWGEKFIPTPLKPIKTQNFSALADAIKQLAVGSKGVFKSPAAKVVLWLGEMAECFEKPGNRSSAFGIDLRLAQLHLLMRMNRYNHAARITLFIQRLCANQPDATWYLERALPAILTMNSWAHNVGGENFIDTGVMFQFKQNLNKQQFRELNEALASSASEPPLNINLELSDRQLVGEWS
ncbi:hypothetical protein BK816_00415 [Boudabousia tangfeifanii]|uniref:Uncharacterized protein n=1 Tax=Boudabousia tangfeifanii TaxID=1912795 RepID=A0A1D9MI15_9ACTO|nr:hypothetical protein [Boudabousia tangfeifanii]AOZ71942.1 hypothetical protein BK816_00415 [Boudabousia tangfeifanii]